MSKHCMHIWLKEKKYGSMYIFSPRNLPKFLTYYWWALYISPEKQNNRIYSRPLVSTNIWFQGDHHWGKTMLTRMHRVQCCTANAWLIFTICSPTSAKDMLSFSLSLQLSMFTFTLLFWGYIICFLGSIF
jgi:hypothetical protein